MTPTLARISFRRERPTRALPLAGRDDTAEALQRDEPAGGEETAGKLANDEQLKELKERGLGTPATRAAIIETLLDRGYISRDRKALAATNLGRYLVALV